MKHYIRNFSAVLISLALLSAADANVPHLQTPSALISSLTFASPYDAQLLATASPSFTLYAEKGKVKVERYTLRPQWKGFGEVTWQNDPSGVNAVLWYSGFYHPSGAKAYVDSTYVLQYLTPFAQADINQKSYITSFFQNSLKKRCHSQDVCCDKVTISAGKDPQLLKYVDTLASQYKATIPNTKVSSREVVGLFTIKKNGQTLKAKCEMPLIITEVPFVTGNIATSVTILGVETLIYPQSGGETVLKEAMAIISSREIDNNWTQQITQLQSNISQSQAQHVRQRTQIINNTYDDINNMHRDSQRRYNESQNRLSQQRSDAIRGETTVTDPFDSNRTITTDNNADHVWVNNQGQQINTSTPNYSPNQDKRVNNNEWRQVR